MREYLSQNPPLRIPAADTAVGAETSSIGVPVFMQNYNHDSYTTLLMRPPEDLVRMGVGAEMALVMMYVVVVWAVKSVFLCFIRQGWGKLKGVAKGMWWGTVGVVGASFVGIVVGGVVVVGMAVGKGDV